MQTLRYAEAGIVSGSENVAQTGRLNHHLSLRRTSLGRLSSRTQMNWGCHNRPSPVHSTNDTSTTIFGFTHRNAAMFSAVMPSPQWPVLLHGRFVNGHLGLREGLTYRLFVIRTAAILWPLRRVTSLRSRT